MKRILLSGLSVSLGLMHSPIRAEELAWRAVGSRSAPAAPPKSPAAQPVAAVGPSAIVPVVYRFESGPVRPDAVNAFGDPAGRTRISAQSGGEEQSTEPPPLPLPKVAPPAMIPAAPAARVSPYLPSAVDPAPTSSSAVPALPSTTDVTAAPPPAKVEGTPVYLICDNPVEVMNGGAPRLQVTAEYLLWWVKGSQVPPLLTTSPPNGANGIPGTVPGAIVLIDGEDLDDATRHGGRFGVVWWFDRCASYGFDSRIFFTGERTHQVTVSSMLPNGTDISLFRPFFAANTFTFAGATFPGPFVEQVTANGIASGSFTARQTSSFWGAEANFRDCEWCWTDCVQSVRADLLVGFRYLHLDEDLTLVEDAVRRSPSAAFPDEIVGTRVVATDRFRTSNDFYGGQVGAAVNYSRNRWTADLRTTVALGTTSQRVKIEGNQIRGPLAGGGTFVAQGGLFALPSNIGETTRNALSVVPEIGVTVGYQVTDHWRAFVGYNFLYWNNVVRPADQIDTTVDVTRVPRFVPPGLVIPPANAVHPAPLFQSTDFWAQGVNLGVEYRW